MDPQPEQGLQPWREVARGVYLKRVEPESVTIGLVVGSSGALLVDTGASPTQGRALRASITEVTAMPLTAVAVTHWHYDHAFGLAAFDDLDTIGHESLHTRLSLDADAPHSAEIRRRAAENGFDATELVWPNRELAVVKALDLGDRRVEIAHLGRGHTDGDLVVVVPDADLFFAGDLIESAGPPSYGPDSYPAEWAATLDGTIGLMTNHTMAIPGHGDPVDREFVFTQRGEIAAVYGEIRRLVESGVEEAAAVNQGSWPYPDQAMVPAIARGYAELRGQGIRPGRPPLPLA